MRGIFGLVSLLIVGVGAAIYFTSAQPALQGTGQYQKIESQANAAAAQMQKDPQAEVDAANGTPPAPAATNAPPAGN